MLLLSRSRHLLPDDADAGGLGWCFLVEDDYDDDDDEYDDNGVIQLEAIRNGSTGQVRWVPSVRDQGCGGGGASVVELLDSGQSPWLIPYCVRFQFGRSVNKAGLALRGNTVLEMLD